MGTHIFLWRTVENYPSVIIKYPPYLFHWRLLNTLLTRGTRQDFWNGGKKKPGNPGNLIKRVISHFAEMSTFLPLKYPFSLKCPVSPLKCPAPNRHTFQWLLWCCSSHISFNGASYSYPTSFGKKYDHFSLSCNQMDISLRKCTLLERLPQRRHFWPNPIIVCMTYISCDEF